MNTATNGMTARQINRRRRLIRKTAIRLAVLAAIVMIGVFGCAGFASARGTRKEDPVDFHYYKSIEVQKGDCLWTIAEEYKDDSFDSVDSYIEYLKELNRLDSDRIDEGRFLVVTYQSDNYR